MKTLLYTMIFSLAFLGAVTVQAEEEILEPTLYTEEVPIPELIAEPILTSAPIVEEVPIFVSVIEEEVIFSDKKGEIKTPSNLGLWWTSVKENFVMTFTFNPEKRVERALAFAGQRMEMAEALALKAETEEEQARAEHMIEKAESFIQKAEEQKLKVEEKTQERLEDQKARIEEHKQKVETYSETKTFLIERIKSGDEGAKYELENLNTRRKEEAELIKLENEVRAETRKMELDKKIEDKKADLERKVMEGDEGAQKALEALEKEEQRLMQQREEVEAKKRELEQNRVEVQAQTQERRGEMIVGGDRDEHGCLGSAGYLWCQSKEKCLRPFEEGWDKTCENIQTETAEPLNNMIQEGDPTPNSLTQPLDRMIQKEVEKAKALINSVE